MFIKGLPVVGADIDHGRAFVHDLFIGELGSQQHAVQHGHDLVREFKRDEVRAVQHVDLRVFDLFCEGDDVAH